MYTQRPKKEMNALIQFLHSHKNGPKVKYSSKTKKNTCLKKIINVKIYSMLHLLFVLEYVLQCKSSNWYIPYILYLLHRLLRLSLSVLSCDPIDS